MLWGSDWRYKSVYDLKISVPWLLLPSPPKAQRLLLLFIKGHFAFTFAICLLIPRDGWDISKLRLCGQQSPAVRVTMCVHTGICRELEVCSRPEL